MYENSVSYLYIIDSSLHARHSCRIRIRSDVTGAHACRTRFVKPPGRYKCSLSRNLWGRISSRGIRTSPQPTSRGSRPDRTRLRQRPAARRFHTRKTRWFISIATPYVGDEVPDDPVHRRPDTRPDASLFLLALPFRATMKSLSRHQCGAGTGAAACRSC